MNLTEFVKKRDGVATWAKFGIGIAAMVILAPLTYLIGYAALGVAYATASMFVAAAVGLAAVNFAPVMAMKFANWKLRALKAEAEANPIETLENQQIEKEKALTAEAQAITEFDTAVCTFRDELENEKVQFPEAYNSGLPTLRNMQRLLEFRRQKYKRAQAALAERRKAVEAARSKYRVALAAQKVTKAAGQIEGNVLDKILEDIAFTSVDNAVNTSMAELRTAIMVEEIPLDDVDYAHVDHKVPLQIEASTPSGVVSAQLSFAQPVPSRR